MSLGCGTLASPSGFRKGNTLASSANGQQHTIPTNPEHRRINIEDVQSYWGAKQDKKATRLWGTTKATLFGGEERCEGGPDFWLRGEYWNVDSNIRRWGEHEIRRNAAAASHDLHRHDQIIRPTIQRPRHQSGETRDATGAAGADSEAGGFDSGNRNAPQDLRPRWNPVASDEQFRAERTYSRNLEQISSHYRMLRRSASLPSTNQPATSQVGEISSPEEQSVERAGLTHGSVSCPGWDRYDHAVKREGAKLALGVHAPSLRAHPEEYPFKDNEMQPASIYTRRFKRGGEAALRTYEPRNTRLSMR